MSTGCNAYCSRCMAYHHLPSGASREQGEKLLSRLMQQRHIDLSGNRQRVDPALETAPLFGQSRGKMFGVLECCGKTSGRLWLYAFSGQYNGRWLVPGWAPPLFDVKAFERINDPIEHRIKELTRRISLFVAGDGRRTALLRQRKSLSQALMQRIHELYRITGQGGMTGTLDEAFGKPGCKPTGTGDCCAPKLLNQAATLGLTPLSMAEFYFGRSNRSGSREHGRFYPPCEDKCQPLLGFMLCRWKTA